MPNSGLKKIQLLSRIPAFHTFYRIGTINPPMPVNITISLLYSCNSRCMTCNVYEKKVKTLKIDEYDKIFSTLGQAPFWFTMSGGEPFIRKDIVEVCTLAYEKTRPAIINIPTNGSLDQIVPVKAEQIIKNCPETDVIINLSLDQIGEEHDNVNHHAADIACQQSQGQADQGGDCTGNQTDLQ